MAAASVASVLVVGPWSIRARGLDGAARHARSAARWPAVRGCWSNARTASSPQALTSVMIAAFAFKLVFFGAYVAVMIRVVALRPVPFIASFTGYLAGLYLMEALYLRQSVS